jgi:hypothetical protein
MIETRCRTSERTRETTASGGDERFGVSSVQFSVQEGAADHHDRVHKNLGPDGVCDYFRERLAGLLSRWIACGGMRMKSPGCVSTTCEPTDRARRTIVLPAFAVEALMKHRKEQAKRRLLLGKAWEDNDIVVDRRSATRRRLSTLEPAPTHDRL